MTNKNDHETLSMELRKTQEHLTRLPNKTHLIFPLLLIAAVAVGSGHLIFNNHINVFQKDLESSSPSPD